MTTVSKTMEENVKKLIYSLLTSTPLTTTIQQLSRDYRNNIGDGIPYHQFGYNSLEHFLKSIPDIATVRGNGPYAEVLPITSNHGKSAHVNELVTRQKVPPKKKSFSGPMAKRKIHYPTKFLPQSSIPPRFTNKPPDQITTKPPEPIYTKPPEPRYTKSPEPMYTKPPEPMSKKSPEPMYTKPPEPMSKKSPEPVNKMPSIQPNYDNNSSVNQSTNNYTTYKVPNSITRALNPSPNCSSSSGTPKSSNLTPLLDDSVKTMAKSVPVRVRDNLKVLISRYPEGIWCAEVPSIYRKMFRADLNYREYGFGSLIDLCSNLTSIFHYCRPGSEDFKLYDRSRPLPDCVEKNFTLASYSVTDFETENSSNALPVIDWLDVLQYLPKSVFQPGSEIPRTFVPENTKPNDNFDVNAGEVYDLSKFWVYLDDGKLNKLMDDLQKFYSCNAAEYYMPENLIREGIYCVHVIFNEYHRALIVDVLPDVEGMIRVVFIDYGTTAKVSTEGLCYLHSDFAQLPAQAIRCRLANLWPPEEGTTWKREAAKCFRQSITNKDLVMTIAKVNWKENFLEVYLADVTNQDNIFYINQYLVDAGHAIFSDQEQTKTISLQSSIVRYIHLFPSFLELELGVSPSAQEMEVLYELNVPINFAFPQYFNWDFSSEEALVKDLENFYETRCLPQKRDVNMHFYDLSQHAPQPIDLSVFGELQSEIMEEEEVTEATAKTLSSTPEDKDDEDNEEELLKCVTDIKRDCILAEDIMKDLEDIYTVADFEDNLTDSDGRSNVVDEEERVDPLSGGTSSPRISSKDSFEDLPMNRDSRETFNRDFEADLQEIEAEMSAMSLCDLDEESGESGEAIIKMASTNPFLQDLEDSPTEEDLQLALVSVKNPFLNFLDDDTEVEILDLSDADSGSTIYETFTEEIKVKQTWSTNDSGPTESYNRVEMISRYAGSTADSQKLGSLKAFDVASQVSTDDVRSCRSMPIDFPNPTYAQYVAQCQQFPPAAYQGYNHPNHWTNFGNPYRFPSGYPQYPSYGYNQPYDPNYQYGFDGYQAYPRPPFPPAYPTRQPPPGFSPRVPLFRPPMMQGPAVMTMNTMNVGSQRDFYDYHNQQLLASITNVTNDIDES